MSLQYTLQAETQGIYPLRVLNRLWNQSPTRPYKASELAGVIEKETGNSLSPQEVAIMLKESGGAKRIINKWGEKGWVPCENPISPLDVLGVEVHPY